MVSPIHIYPESCKILGESGRVLNTGRVLLDLSLAFLIIVSGLGVSVFTSKATTSETYPTSGAAYGMTIAYSFSGVTLGPYEDEYHDLEWPQVYGPGGGKNFRYCALYFTPGNTLAISGNFHRDNVGSWSRGAHACLRYWALGPNDDYRTSPNYKILDWWFSPTDSSWSSWDQPFSVSLAIPADAAYVGFELFMDETAPVEYQSPGYGGSGYTYIHARSEYTISAGAINLLIVPVSLQDQTIAYSLAYYKKMAQKLTEYFDAVSYGHLKINVQVFQNGADWVKLPKTSNDYGSVSYADTGNTFYIDAIDSIDAFVNFTNFDYSDDNGKGIIALVTPNNIFTDGCFSWSFEQNPHFNTNDNTKIDVIYVFEDRFEGANALIRALAHEFAHTLGKILVTDVQQGAKWGKWELPDEYMMGNVQATYSLMGKYVSGVERINLDSWTKEWLGWLKYSKAQTNTPYLVKPLDQMQYGDSVLTYEYTKPNNQKLSYIFEARSNISTTWDNETVWNKALNIYCLEDAPNAFAQHTINLAKTLSANDNFTDPNVGIVVKLNSYSDQDANITIYDYNLVNSVGAVMSSLAKVLADASKLLLPDTGFSTLPDLDLHAYADDGRHVGMNYQTGVYENQIDGAIASGDLTGGTEWIFVPSSVNVTFATESSDTAKFFQQYPEASGYSNGAETYTINNVYYGPDGSRYESQPVEQEISPGSTMEHSYSVTQNTDGSYSITTSAATNPGSTPTPSPLPIATLIIVGIVIAVAVVVGVFVGLRSRKRKKLAPPNWPPPPPPPKLALLGLR